MCTHPAQQQLRQLQSIENKGTKPQRERRGEPEPCRPPVHDWIGEDRDVLDTIKARQHAWAKSSSPRPDQREVSPSQDNFGPPYPSCRNLFLLLRMFLVLCRSFRSSHVKKLILGTHLDFQIQTIGELKEEREQ